MSNKNPAAVAAEERAFRSWLKSLPAVELETAVRGIVGALNVEKPRADEIVAKFLAGDM